MAAEEGEGAGRSTGAVSFPTLTTERLVLRPLRPDDAAALHPVLANEDLMIWWSSGPHQSLDETEKYVAANCAEPYSPTWAITFPDDDTAAGWVVLLPRRDGLREIGYILHPDHWGEGIAREAVSRVIGHGFNDLTLRKIYADVDPDNAASVGLLKRLGFRQEGYLREEWETHIGVRDSLIFGLLRSEWQNIDAK